MQAVLLLCPKSKGRLLHPNLTMPALWHPAHSAILPPNLSIEAKMTLPAHAELLVHERLWREWHKRGDQ